MKKTLLVLFCLLLAAFAFSMPSNVACLDSSLALLWKTAGGEVSITVGETITRNIVTDAVLVDRTAGMRIDKEILLSSKPDLVIGSALLSSHTGTANVLSCRTLFYDIDSFDSYLAALDELTDITGRKDLFEIFGTQEKNEIEKILEKSRNNTPKKVLVIRAGRDESVTKALSSSDHFASSMVSELGCINIADNRKVLTDTFSSEAVLRENPDLILVILKGDEDLARSYVRSIFSTGIFRYLKAVRNNNVIFLDRELFHYKPIGRWAEAYRTMYEVLYE